MLNAQNTLTITTGGISFETIYNYATKAPSNDQLESQSLKVEKNSKDFCDFFFIIQFCWLI